MIGLINDKCCLTSFDEIINNNRGINEELYKIAKTISNY